MAQSIYSVTNLHQRKKSTSLGGPFRSFPCSSRFLGKTSSVSSPDVEKYLSSTIWLKKNKNKMIIILELPSHLSDTLKNRKRKKIDIPNTYKTL